ncbi:hypothetical protein LCGC14_0750450 [marine sediment metagenome]|uniref:Uncharacterized protein n=1 Tax=marine sediment metagenome TaxID=412755 RepID=A0A0F9Q8C4_9ZZZZ
MLESLYNATDNLINQQFYKAGRDIIIGRTPEVSLKISNSGQIIRKFKNIFNENLQIFLDGKYLKFLNLFKKIKGMDENYIQEIYQDLELKFENLKNANAENINDVVLYSLVLNSLISTIRDLNFGEAIKEIKKRVKSKMKISNTKIQYELDKMFMKNDDNVSILYNICYLDTLAESFNYKKVAKVCKIQISRYINRIVKLVITSAN